MEKAYTPWRRFLAVFGFVNLFAIYPAAIAAALIWANHFINADLIK